MLVKKTDVLSFIPQRQPMVMVDELVSSDEVSSISSFRLKQENIFCSEGFFTEAGLIENMAQTAALKAGFDARQKNEKVKVGFIGAVKNLKIYQLPADDQKITTTLIITHNFGNVSIVKGEIRSGDILQAEAELSIFTQEVS